MGGQRSADVVRHASLVIAMLCEREAERRGITRDQFMAQFRAEAMQGWADDDLE